MDRLHDLFVVAVAVLGFRVSDWILSDCLCRVPHIVLNAVFFFSGDLDYDFGFRGALFVNAEIQLIRRCQLPPRQ